MTERLGIMNSPPMRSSWDKVVKDMICFYRFLFRGARIDGCPRSCMAALFEKQFRERFRSVYI